MYYIRLTLLREAILKSAKQRWSALAGTLKVKENLQICIQLFLYVRVEKPRHISKILDIQAGQLCYMFGTIYLEMSSKPNVMKHLEDEVRYYNIFIMQYIILKKEGIL